MRVYTVLVDPAATATDQNAVLVREGFSWPAALFTVLWALYHRLWLWAAILFAAGAVLGAGAAWLGLDAVSRAAIQLGYMALVGLNAEDWRRRRLVKRGYIFAGVAVGRNLVTAEQRFFDRQSFVFK
ncbi:MAG: DUF2628 domain-containing protein [Alphaproteobacteria bacterium]